MRNVLLLLAAITITAVSCSKSSHNEPPDNDNGCIERAFVPLSDPILTPSQIRTADSLLDAIHVNHSNYRYLGLREDSINSRFEQFITADQYANGLRLLTSEINYLFYNGILNYTSTTPTRGTTLDTVPSLSLARLRTLFSSDLKKQEAQGGVGRGLRDSCYRAEFGYYNIAADNAPEDLIKAWRVSIKHTGIGAFSSYPNDLPYAYYKDSNGQLIGFGRAFISFD